MAFSAIRVVIPGKAAVSPAGSEISVPAYRAPGPGNPVRVLSRLPDPGYPMRVLSSLPGPRAPGHASPHRTGHHLHYSRSRQPHPPHQLHSGHGITPHQTGNSAICTAKSRVEPGAGRDHSPARSNSPGSCIRRLSTGIHVAGRFQLQKTLRHDHGISGARAGRTVVGGAAI